MSRKRTIKISDLIETINERNCTSTCNPDIRHGWNAMLESILHDANVYAGYNNLTEDMMKVSAPCGVIHHRDENGTIISSERPDDSRRFYYVHRSLRNER